MRRFLDLGSGGGYPGLPLALALPAERALLVDSIAKKAAFLEVAVAAAGVAGRVEIAAARAESLAADRRHRERWPAVTVRAVASLAELVELAFPLLAPGGVLVAWKRGSRPTRSRPAGGRPTSGRVRCPPSPRWAAGRWKWHSPRRPWLASRITCW